MKKTAALATIALLTALGAGYTAPQSGQDLFQKALVQERTEGNLQQAIQLYQRIVREFSDDHPLAAKALLQMGECYEKLGKEGARKAYERVVRDYPDQSQAAEQARIRLAALRKAAVKETAMATRKVWAGPGVDVQGSVSADGRYLSFNDGATGDLAIHDLETGKNRRLTNKGSWQKSRAWPDSATWSPDGKQLAYGWYDGDLCVDLDVIAREGGNPASSATAGATSHGWKPMTGPRTANKSSSSSGISRVALSCCWCQRRTARRGS